MIETQKPAKTTPDSEVAVKKEFDSSRRVNTRKRTGKRGGKSSVH